MAQAWAAVGRGRRGGDGRAAGGVDAVGGTRDGRVWQRPSRSTTSTARTGSSPGCSPRPSRRCSKARSLRIWATKRTRSSAGTPALGRNGRYRRTLKTEGGEQTIAVPRDRNGSFEPQIIRTLPAADQRDRGEDPGALRPPASRCGTSRTCLRSFTASTSPRRPSAPSRTRSCRW
ncbi:MAG: transposase [Ardenticatenales bacterium]|nr:transposase [Ardenticatenales bacterium]